MNVLFGRSERTGQPRRLRVKTYLDQWGQQVYLLQAKYFLFWEDNFETTKSPHKLLWAVKGLGKRLDDLTFVAEGKAKVNMVTLKRLQRDLDYFPHKAPKEVKESEESE